MGLHLDTTFDNLQVVIFHSSWHLVTSIQTPVMRMRHCHHSGSLPEEEQCRFGSGTERRRRMMRVLRSIGRHRPANSWSFSSRSAETGWMWHGSCLTDSRPIRRRSGWSEISSSKIPTDYLTRCTYKVIVNYTWNEIAMNMYLKYIWCSVYLVISSFSSSSQHIN